ncbi:MULTISPECIES: DUF1289 domain-containing protein [unclassified Acidovorax]|uniref:DUF1289 domain-containing protein n=1 Tax=unclassified Acidovorax TaxID=2684926 RepID=UPI0010F1AD40|nr:MULTISPECIES: DUF1289 domain-containing protein [unclassified Acidovorax]RYF72405.1 MAG: DUF1289 domain-containing protein [Comamonadaceae bacterium]
MADAIELIAARACEISAAGHFDAESEAAVPSPCIGVCRMTADRSQCEGCFRTLDEIRVWSTASSLQRRAIWATLLHRAGLPPLAAQPATR